MARANGRVKRPTVAAHQNVRLGDFGAGGGNRTLIFSLESWCVNSNKCFIYSSITKHAVAFCRLSVGKELLERVGGIEPPSPVWKTGVLTITQHPLNKMMHISWGCGRQDGVYRFPAISHPRRANMDLSLLAQICTVKRQNRSSSHSLKSVSCAAVKRALMSTPDQKHTKRRRESAPLGCLWPDQNCATFGM